MYCTVKSENTRMCICQLMTTCIVVIYLCRMLSDTVEHMEAMLSCVALKPVAALLHSDDSVLLHSAIKTVSCFIYKLEFYLYVCRCCRLELGTTSVSFSCSLAKNLARFLAESDLHHVQLLTLQKILFTVASANCH